MPTDSRTRLSGTEGSSSGHRRRRSRPRVDSTETGSEHPQPDKQPPARQPTGRRPTRWRYSEPKPAMVPWRCRSCPGSLGSPGYRTWRTAGWPSSRSARICAFAGPEPAGVGRSAALGGRDRPPSGRGSRRSRVECWPGPSRSRRPPVGSPPRQAAHRSARRASWSASARRCSRPGRADVAAGESRRCCPPPTDLSA